MIIRGLNPDQIVQAIARTASSQGGLRCVSDHRQLQAGDVWFAVPGKRFDPRSAIAQADTQGVHAVVADATGWTEGMTAQAEALQCPVYLLESLGEQAGDMASRLLFADTAPARLIAVTGTNGKTSVTRWVAQCLSDLNERCGVVGTLGAGFPDGDTEHTGLTTPDAVSLQTALAQLSRKGARAIALEASSIGLDQGRLNGCRFSVAAFTNLSRDHLDYHGDMLQYEQSKQLLFKWAGLHRAVINMDDPAATRFCEVARQHGVPVVRVTANAKAVSDVAENIEDWLCLEGVHSSRGLTVTLEWTGDRAQAEVPVVGQFNLENVAVVAGILLSCGYPLQSVAQSLQSITPPAGRMQMIAHPDKPLVVVDYAHTPDALDKVLGALRPVAQARKGQLVCVFGCGGDRDPGKRPQMGAVAEQGADRVVVTSDNPRSESPQSILDAILAGVSSHDRFRVEIDRSLAIRSAIHSAAANDVVLLAGKGHETGQITGTEVLPFSDEEQALLALNAYVSSGEGA